MGDVQGIDFFQRISMACRDREPCRQRTGKPLGSGDADQPPAFVNLGGMVDSVGPQVVGNDPLQVGIQCGQRGGQLVGDAPEHLLHGVIETSLDEAGRVLPDPLQFPGAAPPWSRAGGAVPPRPRRSNGRVPIFG